MGGHWRLQTYSVLIKLTKLTKLRSKKIMGGRWRYKLIVSLNLIYEVPNTQIHKLTGGRWRYKLIVSLKCTVYNTKIQKLFRGVCWH